MSGNNTRAGRVVRQMAGYRAFVPAPLPPDPPIQFDSELISLLSQADQAVARLDGISSVLPDPDLFVAMYVRQEAVLSSQIEGTQSSLDDVLEFEADPESRDVPPDVSEVVNYVRAMNHGLERLSDFPLSLRLIREIHQILLEDVRGSDRRPGGFRTSQNWIGPAGATLDQATFIPPPPSELLNVLDAFERYLHADDLYPILVHTGLVHAQFETIHPFLDGNGRVGRLLITFLLCHHEVLQRPLLYLSNYLKLHRSEYYDRLSAIRIRGDWEGWLRFYLRGMASIAQEAARTGLAIVTMREQQRALLAGQSMSPHAFTLLDRLFRTPIVSVNGIRDALDVSYPTANSLVGQFVAMGLLYEITGRRRHRLFRFSPYLALFASRDTETFDSAPVETTETEIG